MSPSRSEKQRQFMGAELGRKRRGEKTKTDMSEEQLEEFASKPISKEMGSPMETTASEEPLDEGAVDEEQKDTFEDDQDVADQLDRQPTPEEEEIAALEEEEASDDADIDKTEENINDQQKIMERANKIKEKKARTDPDYTRTEFSDSPKEEMDKDQMKKSIDELVKVFEKGFDNVSPEELEKANDTIKKFAPALGALAGHAAKGAAGHVAYEVAKKVAGTKDTNKQVKKAIDPNDIYIEDPNLVKQWRQESGFENTDQIEKSIPTRPQRQVRKSTETDTLREDFNNFVKALDSGDDGQIEKSFKILNKSWGVIARQAGKGFLTGAKKTAQAEAPKAAEVVGAELSRRAIGKISEFARKHPKTAAAGLGGLGLLASRGKSDKTKSVATKKVGEAKNDGVQLKLPMKTEKMMQKARALLKVNKAMELIKGYEPMTDEDLIKSFGDTPVPSVLIEEESRPPAGWWDTAIQKATNVSDEPVNFAIDIWYGKSVDVQKKLAHTAATIGGSGLGGKVGGALGSALGPVGTLAGTVGGSLLGGELGSKVVPDSQKMQKEAVGKKVIENMKKLKKSADGEYNATEVGEMIFNSIGELEDMFQNAVAEPTNSKVSPKAKPAGNSDVDVNDGSRMDVESLTDKKKDTKTY